MTAPHPADWTFTGAYRIPYDKREREHHEALREALSEAIALPDVRVDVLIDMNVDGYRVRASVMMLAIDTLDCTGLKSEAEIRAKIAELGPKMRAAMLRGLREYLHSSEPASSSDGRLPPAQVVGGGADSGEDKP